MDDLISRAVGDKDLTSGEIPNIDLYIDQILTLVADKNSASSTRYLENHLTKTMINNYSKEGVIMPVKGKKYTKEHIIQMLLIYSLKNSLSIGEINRLIQGIYGEGFDGGALTACYDDFVALKDDCRAVAGDTVRSLVKDEELDLSDSRDFCLALLGVVACSAYLKAIAEEMLEARYPVPERSKGEEKDKEKSKEKQKEKSKKADKKTQPEKTEE